MSVMDWRSLIWQPTAQAVQFELINAAHSFRILPVVLDEVEVVGSRQETCERGCLRVP